MKKKDIIVLAICTVVIMGSIYFIMRGFSSKPSAPVVENKETINFTGEIDKEAIDKLQKRKDYGSPTMDNIGRENPFASF